MDIQLTSSETLNTNQQGVSLPVEVKLYQLNDSESFLQLTFYDIWKNNFRKNENGIVADKVITIVPNSEKKIYWQKQY